MSHPADIPANAGHSPAAALRATLLLTGAVALLHLLVLGQVALSVDEAHYALYGLYPDLSYYDHPPLVGWLQALVLHFSDAEWALRLWPLLLSIASALLLYRLVRELFAGESPWIGFIAVAILQSAILFQLLSMALVPELPLLLFGLLAVLMLSRALERDRLGEWLLFGVALGLAGLAKYTAILLPISALLYVAWNGQWRALARPGPWLAGLLAVLMVVPVFWWNYQNDWISFAYQMGHGAPARAWQLDRALLSQVGQLLAYAPGIYIFGLMALWASRRELHHPGVRLLLVVALPTLLLFGFLGGFKETLPHWTLLGWALLTPLIARWLVANWSRRGVRGGAKASAAWSILLVAVIHLQFSSPWLPFPAYNHPMQDLYGWREAAERAEVYRQALAASAISEPVIYVSNWTHASRIAWYARPAPVQVLDDRMHQFDFWFGSHAPGGVGILVVPGDAQTPTRRLDWFDECESLPALPVVQGDRPVQTFHFHACRELKPRDGAGPANSVITRLNH